MSIPDANHPSTKLSTLVFVGLLGLPCLAVAIPQFRLGRWSFPAGMMIATAKAILIVLYFMQLRYSQPLVRLFAIGGVFWVAIMIGLLFCDFLTRT